MLQVTAWTTGTAIDAYSPTPNDIRLAEARARNYWSRNGSRFGPEPANLAVETSKVLPMEAFRYGAHRCSRFAGVQAGIDRAAAYVEAGADMIFAEALSSLEDYRAFTNAVGTGAVALAAAAAVPGTLVTGSVPSASPSGYASDIRREP